MGDDKFKVEALHDGYDHCVRATRNGYQWQCLTLDTLDQVEAVAVAALNYVVAARKLPTTDKAAPR